MDGFEFESVSLWLVASKNTFILWLIETIVLFLLSRFEIWFRETQVIATSITSFGARGSGRRVWRMESTT